MAKFSLKTIAMSAYLFVSDQLNPMEEICAGTSPYDAGAKVSSNEQIKLSGTDDELDPERSRTSRLDALFKQVQVGMESVRDEICSYDANSAVVRDQAESFSHRVTALSERLAVKEDAVAPRDRQIQILEQAKFSFQRQIKSLLGDAATLRESNIDLQNQLTTGTKDSITLSGRMAVAETHMCLLKGRLATLEVQCPHEHLQLKTSN